MKLKEGVLANNDILNFDEFKIFMKQRLNNEIISDLIKRFNNIEKNIKNNQYKKAYQEWENLQRDILLNKQYTVSLLFIENIDSDKKNMQYKYNTSEYNIMSDRGKLSRLSQLNEKLFQESIEEQITEHLHEFINDVSTQTLRWKFIEQIFEIGDSERKRNASNARWKTHNWTYKNIMYGNNPSWLGNVADAFVNHMAHLHVQTIAGKVQDVNKKLFSQSVFNEEKDNIFNLIYASRNNTSWITGGDVIVKYQGQIYNIQLKTGQISTRRRSRIGGKLAVKDLLIFIEQIKTDLEVKDIDRIILKMYNELKTSGWVEITNDFINEVTDSLITDNLTN